MASPLGRTADSETICCCRSMCEAIAATGAHRAVLRALRSHYEHEAVVAASCKMLLAFQEEFEGSDSMPSALVAALRSVDTLHALEAAQQTFDHSTEIQLGSEWAVGVGRVAREKHKKERARAEAAAEAAGCARSRCALLLRLGHEPLMGPRGSRP